MRDAPEEWRSPRERGYVCPSIPEARAALLEQWEADFKAGWKVGKETYWSADGMEKWNRQYGEGGREVFTVFDEAGRRKAESAWRRKKLMSYRLGK